MILCDMHAWPCQHPSSHHNTQTPLHLLASCCFFLVCSYLWADVMSADGFMAFEEAGITNEAQVKRLGRKFRDTFLSLGGSLPPAQVFRMFRGRDPRVEEVIKYNELDKVRR